MVSRRDRVRTALMYWVGFIVVVSSLTWTAYTVVALRQDLHDANTARNALIEQVKDLGGTPVVGPEGKAGPRGEPGKDGQPGADGRDGSPGSSGTSGRDGEDGAAGADGPSGPAGPKGEKGDKGDAGKDGRDGVDGAKGDKGDQGEPGPTCPVGFSPTERTELSGTTIIVCVKDE